MIVVHKHCNTTILLLLRFEEPRRFISTIVSCITQLDQVTRTTQGHRTFNWKSTSLPEKQTTDRKSASTMEVDFQLESRRNMEPTQINLTQQAAAHWTYTRPQSCPSPVPAAEEQNARDRAIGVVRASPSGSILRIELTCHTGFF